MHTRIFQAISTFLSASMNMANSRTKTFPLGMPLPSIMDSLKRHGECISVISFNLLAPLYVRPIDKRTGKVQPFAAFEWVKDDSLLEWPLRKSRLLDALRTCRAQVICVQELQLERSNSDQQASFQIPTWLSPMVEKCGYEVILPPSDQLELIAERNIRVLDADVAVTCAVLVQSKHWNIVTESRDHEKDDTASTLNSNTCVSVCLENKENTTIDPLVVTSVHLDATDEQKRIRQLSKCFERANFLLHSAIKSKEQQQQQQNASNNDEKKSTIVPLTAIIAGDMNAEFQTGSCMHSILQNRRPSNDDDTQKACAESLRLSSLSTPTPKQLEEWKELQIEASQLLDDYCVSLDRVDTGATRCAYSHNEDNKDNDDDVSVPAMESWKLDHILYTTSRLTPLARWSTLESDDESSSIGLPSQNCPSDHLPIAAVFELLPKNVQLDPSTKKETLYQIVHLSITHQKALENTDMIMEAKQKAILKQLADTKGDDSFPEQTVSKKKKLKKRPPPQEIIHLIREKRALIKDLKHQQQCEREQLVKNFSQLQRLVVQEHFGMSWKEWAKSGS